MTRGLRAWRSLKRAKWPALALLLLLAIGFAAAFGPRVAPHDPNRQNIVSRLKQPMQTDRRGRTLFVMGTDGLGRDVFSRLLYGARVSLIVAFVAVLIGGSVGTLLGLIAGYFGGAIDRVIMSVADIQLAFPFILLRPDPVTAREGVRRGGEGAGSRSCRHSADRHPAEYSRTAHHHRVVQRRQRHSRGGRALLSRTRRAADRAELGRHAGRKPRSAARGPLVARGVPGNRDHAHRAVVQHLG